MRADMQKQKLDSDATSIMGMRQDDLGTVACLDYMSQAKLTRIWNKRGSEGALTTIDPCSGTINSEHTMTLWHLQEKLAGCSLPPMLIHGEPGTEK